MSQVDDTLRCPHCGEPLKSFDMPLELGYDSPIHEVCFNDDCPYFRRGWSWMKDNYNVKGSYRYRVDPITGVASPLSVWSEEALKDRIIDG
jgi:hypothetical protein